MSSVVRACLFRQDAVSQDVVSQDASFRGTGWPVCRWALLLGASLVSATALAQAPPIADPTKVADAGAKTAAEMKPYTEVIANTQVTFKMLPIPGGTYQMGSPASEAGRKDDEGPTRAVTVEPFWMEEHEVTWNEYEIWMFSLDIQRRGVNNEKPSALDLAADAVTRPTKPYTDMSFGMGKDGFPAISMTQLSAKTFCKWLSAKTGRYYRLPTEAEWEYACRAGSKTAYSFGDDPKQLGDYAWYSENSGDAYHKVALKKPNPWGLYDMHGNVIEWTLDGYDPNAYAMGGKTVKDSLNIAKKLYPQSARGGSWDDEVDRLRSAARRGSHRDWKQQDPQIPQSIWYFTDAQFLGFRVVRPLVEPSEEEKKKLWEAGSDEDKFGDN
jgi:formylglycine-generating enzyme required for sulfatase activity